METRVNLVGVGVDSVDTLRVEHRSTALYAVYDISFREKEARQIGAILTRYASDEGSFHKTTTIVIPCIEGKN
jgi:hypothetical protein